MDLDIDNIDTAYFQKIFEYSNSMSINEKDIIEILGNRKGPFFKSLNNAIFDFEKKMYDKMAIVETCEYLTENNYAGIVVIKSTVEPMTTEHFSNLFPKLEFVHNPEFLTARTAYQDFHNQRHVVIGFPTNASREKNQKIIEFYSKHYPSAEISVCTSTESESMKIFCNSFYAVKIQFFTE